MKRFSSTGIVGFTHHVTISGSNNNDFPAKVISVVNANLVVRVVELWSVLVTCDGRSQGSSGCSFWATVVIQGNTQLWRQIKPFLFLVLHWLRHLIKNLLCTFILSWCAEIAIFSGWSRNVSRVPCMWKPYPPSDSVHPALSQCQCCSLWRRSQ